MKKISLLFLFLVLSFSAQCQSNASEFKHYKWNSKADQKKYTAFTWKAMEIDPLQIIWPGLRAEMKYECTNRGNPTMESYLKKNGGMCGAGIWLEVSKGGQIEKINSPLALTKLLLPIDSETKAGALLALTHDVPYYGQGKIKMNLVKSDQDFLIQTPMYVPFGCTDIASLDGIFIVSSSGEVKQIATHHTKGPQICRD